MAQVIRRNGYEYKEFVHRCGEIVNAKIKDNAIVGYADISRVPITICPHCLKPIEYEDIQTVSNVEFLNWPD